MIKEEVWKDVVDLENRYEVSNFGNVRNKLTGKLLKQSIVMNNGYKRVSMGDDNNIRKSYNVHKLVARAFLPNPNNYPIINHKDEDKTNNMASNLEWCDYRYNRLYDKDQSKYKRRNIIQYTLDGKFVKIWSSMTEIERHFDISRKAISWCCNKRREHVKGYIWRFEDDCTDIGTIDGLW